MRFGTTRASALALALLGSLQLSGNPRALAQNSGDGFELHAKGNVTASDVGLPVYPSAKLFKNPDHDQAVDMGFTFGDTHFRLLAANYLSSDSPGQILDFYRKPLARYGEVLECDHGKPVGAIKVARSGLTCSDEHGGHIKLEGSVDSSNGHELRSGTPLKMHVVGIGERKGSELHFALVYLELPKDSAAKTD